MAFDFTGRRAVVAGGSRGIGRSIALAFAQAGAAVSVCARGAEGIARVRAELAAHGHLVHTTTCDLGDAGAIARYIAATNKNPKPFVWTATAKAIRAKLTLNHPSESVH